MTTSKDEFIQRRLREMFEEADDTSFIDVLDQAKVFGYIDLYLSMLGDLDEDQRFLYDIHHKAIRREERGEMAYERQHDDDANDANYLPI